MRPFLIGPLCLAAAVGTQAQQPPACDSESTCRQLAFRSDTVITYIDLVDRFGGGAIFATGGPNGVGLLAIQPWTCCMPSQFAEFYSFSGEWTMGVLRFLGAGEMVPHGLALASGTRMLFPHDSLKQPVPPAERMHGFRADSAELTVRIGRTRVLGFRVNNEFLEGAAAALSWRSRNPRLVRVDTLFFAGRRLCRGSYCSPPGGVVFLRGLQKGEATVAGTYGPAKVEVVVKVVP
ncbi:MAG: hypothetical protein AB7G10_24765 [Reyranellaceae bacterium]